MQRLTPRVCAHRTHAHHNHTHFKRLCDARGAHGWWGGTVVKWPQNKYMYGVSWENTLESGVFTVVCSMNSGKIARAQRLFVFVSKQARRRRHSRTAPRFSFQTRIRGRHTRNLNKPKISLGVLLPRLAVPAHRDGISENHNRRKQHAHSITIKTPTRDSPKV